MPVVSVRIPQLGEGLQEARLVEFLKQPGELVQRDEPIYVMETDKAMTEVESPFAGKLVGWVAKVDTILPIGAEIAHMEVAEGIVSMSADPHGGSHGAHSASHSSASRAGSVPASSPAGRSSSVEPGTTTETRPQLRTGVLIPPRTRKYLLEHNLLGVADLIPALGTKLMPADVDRYLSGEGSVTNVAVAVPIVSPAASMISTEAPTGRARRAGVTEPFVDQDLPQSQITLNSRMLRGVQACVPATLAMDIDWSAIDAARKISKNTTGESGFSMLCWCVSQAMKEFPAFRSSITGEGRILRTYEHVNLGIAVSLPGDLLKTAVIKRADQLEKKDFHEQVKSQIEKVREGQDQIDATTTVTVSNIGASGVRLGIPVVVTPAVATIAIGEIRWEATPTQHGTFYKKVVTLAMTFDHRIVNGVGAANFANKIRDLAQAYQQ